MAYTLGDPILADHYNLFATGDIAIGVTNPIANTVNGILGVGQGDRGYGQTLDILAEVNPGTPVTATQWENMINSIEALANHQGTSLTAMPTLTTGDLISALTQLQTNIADVNTNRLNNVAVGTSQSTNTSGSATWNLTSEHIIDVQFASADAARYFFNAGGYIDLTFSRTGGAGTPKDLDWDDPGVADGLLEASGTIRYAQRSTTKVGGSGTTSILETGIGYYNNPGSLIVFRQNAAGGVYSSNKIEVVVDQNGPQGANLDNGDLLTFTVTMSDTASDPPGVSGTTRVDMEVRFPSTTFLTQSPVPWGAVTFPTLETYQDGVLQ